MANSTNGGNAQPPTFDPGQEVSVATRFGYSNGRRFVASESGVPGPTVDLLWVDKGVNRVAYIEVKRPDGTVDSFRMSNDRDSVSLTPSGKNDRVLFPGDWPDESLTVGPVLSDGVAAGTAVTEVILVDYSKSARKAREVVADLPQRFEYERYLAGPAVGKRISVLTNPFSPQAQVGYAVERTGEVIPLEWPRTDGDSIFLLCRMAPSPFGSDSGQKRGTMIVRVDNQGHMHRAGKPLWTPDIRGPVRPLRDDTVKELVSGIADRLTHSVDEPLKVGDRLNLERVAGLPVAYVVSAAVVVSDQPEEELGAYGVSTVALTFAELDATGEKDFLDDRDHYVRATQSPSILRNYPELQVVASQTLDGFY